MHGLILAGGEGSRLAADGVGEAKAAVAVAGQPQIVRLVDTLAGLGCATITCMVRDAAGDAFRALDHVLASGAGAPLRVLPCRTPSSLHTLVEGLRVVPSGDVFVTMVDTVMRARHWAECYEGAAAALARDADAVLVVTPFVDDERPLWVDRDARGFVREIGDTAVDPPCVTGGVYAFGPRARREADRARRGGLSRMRGFLARLVSDGHRVATVEVPRILDVDRRQDLDAANAWLGADDGE